MNKKAQPDGFSAIEVIIVVALVAAIGLTGWFAWHKNKNSERASAINSTTQTKQADTNTTNTPQGQNNTQPDPAESGKYLVIKEWGVRVLLPDSLKGNVFYALREFDESYGHVEAADINSKLFQPECRDTAGDLGLDVIRTATPPSDTTQYKHLGNYWYSNIYSKDGCSKFLSGAKENAFNGLRSSLGTVELTN